MNEFKVFINVMEYFPRKSISKYLTDTIDFNKHVHDKWTSGENTCAAT